MRNNLAFRSIISATLLVMVCVFVAPGPTQAQVRGQYTPGVNATNSGVTPEPGFTYSNIFQFFKFDSLRGPNGEPLPITGKFSIKVDHNIFMWVSKKKILGATFSMFADLAGANLSLTAADSTQVGGGAGFADSFYQPLTLGWAFKRVDVKVGYGFVAPTGRFTAGAPDNVGSGYWGHNILSGQTLYLTKNKGTAISAYQQYEIHGHQKTTDIHPGQTFNLDYSLTQVIPLKKDMTRLLQLGLIGYGQYQTTDRSGPGINPIVAANTHYRVNSVGFGANLLFPKKKVVLGMKYFNEYSNKSTVQGYSMQFSGAITF